MVPPADLAPLDRLPALARERLRAIARAADGRAWLVGGAVRDLLLDRPAGDVDVVVEGDAAAVARRVAPRRYRRTVFGTVELRWPDGEPWHLVMARRERYAAPAALPSVRAGSLDDDLRRRDFTINAIAVSIAEEHWGQWVDPLGGRADLERRRLRALHAASFIDDPTRLYRAARYVARLGLRVEHHTARWMRQAVAERLVERLSPDRLRHELERSLAEQDVLAQVQCLTRFGLLAPIAPALRAEPAILRGTADLLAAWATWGQRDEVEVWLVWLLALLPRTGMDEVADAVIARLALTRRQMQALLALKSLVRCSGWAVRPSTVAARLDGVEVEALLALAARRPAARAAVESYLRRWRHVRCVLDGHDLLEAGFPVGPSLGNVLRGLRRARLDGRVTDVAGEWALARRLLARDES